MLDIDVVNGTCFNFSDSGFYYMNYDGALCLFDVKSQASIEILDNTTFVSNFGRKIVVATQFSKFFPYKN